MKKSQIISMDFIMSFVVYMFALSVFFFAMKDASSLKADQSLDVSAELLFSRLDQVYSEADFLDGYKVTEDKINNWDIQKAYDFIFRDFENSAAFRRTDYAIYIENRSYENSLFFDKKKVWDVDRYGTNYLIDLGIISSDEPHCTSSSKIESIVLSRPVVYKNNIMNLKILICAEKR